MIAENIKQAKWMFPGFFQHSAEHHPATKGLLNRDSINTLTSKYQGWHNQRNTVNVLNGSSFQSQNI
jgi:hypothetical protein